MSEFKFACPSCGQQLAADVSASGTSMACPSCKAELRVPQPPAFSSGEPPVADRLTPPPPPPPPMGSGIPQAPVRSGPARTSGLAVASIICSVGSFIIIPMGFIPGIICGHMARKRLAEDSSLTGAGLAKAGLIVGYVSLGLHLLAVIALVAFFAIFASRFAHAVQTRQAPTASQPGQPGSQGTDDTNLERQTPADLEPDGSGWTLKLSDASIPDGKVAGRIHGQPFTMDNVQVNQGWIKFRQGSGFFADLEMDVVPFISKPAELYGRTYRVEPQDKGMHPHIWVHWKKPGQNTTEQATFMAGYMMLLEFGQPAGDKLPGKIYLCVPDGTKSFIRGTFELPVEK